MKGELIMETKRTTRKLSTTVIVKAALLAAASIVLTRFFSYMIPLGGLPALRIGFGTVPLIIAGMMLGPLAGGIVGVVSDLTGFLINPMGSMFHPGFTVTAALYGVLSGVLFKKIKIQNMKVNFNYINAVMMVIFASLIAWIVFRGEGLDFGNSQTILMLVLMALVTALFIVLPFVISTKFKNKSSQIAFDKIAFAVSVTYVINALFLNTLWLSMLLDKGFILLLPGRIVASVVTIPAYSWIIYSLSKVIKYTN
jgi:ECF transporter S component (folate family)